MKKKEQIQYEPVMTIMDSFNSGDTLEADKKTFALIESGIINFSKCRNFDCLFLSQTKVSAKELLHSLRKKHGYETEKPYHDEEGWIIHAIIKIIYSDLENTLKAAREDAAKHSSQLIDWMFEVDK